MFIRVIALLLGSALIQSDTDNGPSCLCVSLKTASWFKYTQVCSTNAAHVYCAVVESSEGLECVMLLLLESLKRSSSSSSSKMRKAASMTSIKRLREMGVRRRGAEPEEGTCWDRAVWRMLLKGMGVGEECLSAVIV